MHPGRSKRHFLRLSVAMRHKKDRVFAAQYAGNRRVHVRPMRSGTLRVAGTRRACVSRAKRCPQRSSEVFGALVHIGERDPYVEASDMKRAFGRRS